MMDSKSLKIGAGVLITDSELSKDSKIQLLNFIQSEATDEQVMALMMDGKIISLDEQSGEIIRDRWEASDMDEKIAEGIGGLAVKGAKLGTKVGWKVAKHTVLSPKVLAGAAAGSLATAAIFVANQKLGRSKYDSIAAGAKAACKKAAAKKQCKQEVMAKAREAEIKTLQGATGKFCPKAKDPGKCKSRMSARIDKLQKKHQALSKKLSK